jgi:3-oxoacyl-[acyl-carrier-protein] synthase II
LGRGVDCLFDGWQAGACAIRPLKRFDAHRYQSGLAAEVDLSLLPAAGSTVERLALAALEDALLDSRMSGFDPTGRAVLILATTKADVTPLEKSAVLGRRHNLHENNPQDLAWRLSERCGLKALACQVVSLACASGAAAISYAGELLASRDVPAVVVVGVDALSDFILTGFSSLKSLDPEACKPFDQKRCGLSLGEAGASLVLVGGNVPRSRGVILGWGLTNDAFHLTAPSRDGSGLAAAMAKALDQADLAGGGIHYINAHGTGTVYNDAMEAKAVTRVFGPQVPPLSTLKGTTGHTLGAAGVLETIATLAACTRRVAPAIRGLELSGVEETLDLIQGQPRVLPANARALSLFAGFGGFNAALVMGGAA